MEHCQNYQRKLSENSGISGAPDASCVLGHERFKAGIQSGALMMVQLLLRTKISVSEFVSYLKGNSTRMFSDRYPEYRTKWGDRHFRARGYYVSTAGC